MTGEPATTPLFVPPGTSPPEMPAGDDRPVLRVATARRRIVGRLLDVCAVLAWLVLLFCSALFVPRMVVDDVPDGMASVLLVTPFVAVVTAGLVLRVGLVAWWGCTAGQRIAGLRVVEYPYGTPVRGWATAGRRWFLLRSPSSLGALDDLVTMLEDRERRQCDHDKKAGTVVITGPVSLAPQATSNAGVDTMLPLPVPVTHAASWPARERIYRILLGTALGLAVLAVVALATVEPLQEKIEESQRPPFTVNTFYDDKAHFGVRSPTGRSGTFDRTAARVLDSESGCAAGAVNDQVRDQLRGLGCQGQIETAFRTSDGVVQASGHVLKFGDAAAATRAAGRLRWTDLRFVPGGPTDPPGKLRGGLLDHRDRYLVVTSVVAAEGAGMPEKAKNALILLHVPTVNTIDILFS